MTGRTRILVVPHFMRLHEWIAAEEGLFKQSGLDAELLVDVMRDVSGHGADSYFERPQDEPFLKGQEVANSACEWGSVCNAGAGMGRFVPDLYGVARYAFFVGKASEITRLSDLAGKPVGVGVMAGSHFTALQALELVLTPEQIRVENIGGPGRRLRALLEGEIEVANLLDPEIALAEERGLRKIAGGEFRTLFWVSPGIPAAALEAYFEALREADALLRRQPERHLHLWKHNLPQEFAGEEHDWARFGLGELLVFERYPESTYEETLAFARRWGLDGNVRQREYASLST
jgi:ABC-type nitrate/sulfonate/bicarbonate transport system substrate-binding protein